VALLEKCENLRKNGKIYVKKVKFPVKTDKRAENEGRHRRKGAAEGAAQFVT